MDYLMGLLLLASPWLFGFARGGAETAVPVVLAIMMLLLSIMTNYELGLVKMIPMKVHLGMDLVSGLFLAASPWIFGFSDYVFVPHLILGLLEVMASLTTQDVPFRKTQRREAIV
jgi:hypothetical protein